MQIKPKILLGRKPKMAYITGVENTINPKKNIYSCLNYAILHVTKKTNYAILHDLRSSPFAKSKWMMPFKQLFFYSRIVKDNSK